MTVGDKYQELRKIIASNGPMLVSYSGGVDSTLLAAVARDVLGEGSRCVLLDSAVVPRAAAEQARSVARDLGLVLEILPVQHLEHREFMENSPERCYFCKKIAAGFLKARAGELGFRSIADGMNVSDTKEHRPGLRASDEEGMIHPFIMAGITKQEIREIARDLGIPVWQKPSAACLSSRIPYGEEITAEKLRVIEEAESFLGGLGISQLRVRLHGNIARIEVHKEDMERVLDQRVTVVDKLKSLGAGYVTMDLEGYRSGSMDEVLSREERS